MIDGNLTLVGHSYAGTARRGVSERASLPSVVPYILGMTQLAPRFTISRLLCPSRPPDRPTRVGPIEQDIGVCQLCRKQNVFGRKRRDFGRPRTGVDHCQNDNPRFPVRPFNAPSASRRVVIQSSLEGGPVFRWPSFNESFHSGTVNPNCSRSSIVSIMFVR